jgi:hypothetical protein
VSMQAAWGWGHECIEVRGHCVSGRVGVRGFIANEYNWSQLGEERRGRIGTQAWGEEEESKKGCQRLWWKAELENETSIISREWSKEHVVLGRTVS